MFPIKPISRFILFTLCLLLLLSFFTNSSSASDLDTDNDDEVDKDFEELLALDEQEGQEQDDSQEAADARFSEAEVLSKAQRIVLELNGDNVKRVVEGNEYVLVLGYAPWCARSAELMPQFAEAATLLKELKSPVLLAKLDAERYPKAASSLEIKGFPTLLLFVNGTSRAYTGGFSAAEIVIWARKKTGVPVIRITSVNEAEEFLKKYQSFVLGLFDRFEGPDHEEFVKAAAADNEIQFVETSSFEVAKAAITVKSLSVHNFYVGEGSDTTGVPTKMLTVNGSLKIGVYNPATIFGIHVSSTPIDLVYSEIIVATGQLKKYYQPRKSHRTVSVNLQGNKVPLYGAGSSLSVNSQTGGEVPLTLKFGIRSRGEVVGKLVKTTHKKQITCPLVVDILSTKPIKFKKSSCTYE